VEIVRVSIDRVQCHSCIFSSLQARKIGGACECTRFDWRPRQARNRNSSNCNPNHPVSFLSKQRRSNNSLLGVLVPRRWRWASMDDLMTAVSVECATEALPCLDQLMPPLTLGAAIGMHADSCCICLCFSEPLWLQRSGGRCSARIPLLTRICRTSCYSFCRACAVNFSQPLHCSWRVRIPLLGVVGAISPGLGCEGFAVQDDVLDFGHLPLTAWRKSIHGLCELRGKAKCVNW
jgi:hypothetical protein